jgi:acetamidase/formamidase
VNHYDRAVPRDHVYDSSVIHHEWDLDLPPALVVSSGDTVSFDIRVAGEGQVWPGATYEQARFDFDTIYNLCGPLWVDGAQPGDTLQVDILELVHGDWGWTAYLPGMGLLTGDFPGGYLRTFELKDGLAQFAPGIDIKLAPFCGTMGNHPGEPRRNVPFPPHRGGGNVDNRHLVAGTTVWLPVHVPGAMFSVGDPHAAQGDGEVCVSALEAPLAGTIRFTLHKHSIDAPRYRVPAGSPAIRTDAYQATMGLSGDLMTGAQIAVRSMIGWLGDEHGLSPEDAYLLCSIAGDLKIHEVVDAGVWNVGFTMPLFGGTP